MPLTYNDVKERVHAGVPVRAFRSVYDYVSGKELSLWGAVKPRNFLRMTLYVVLYKDLLGIGYNKLYNQIKGWYASSHSSLRHNTRLLRTECGCWGRRQIKVGTPSEWNGAARHVPRSKDLRGVNLWVDSSDFRLKGRSSVSRKDDMWSYKENSPAQRFMMLSDGKMRPRMISHGYSPKTYDSTWIRSHRSYLDRHFSAGVAVGDTHFFKGSSYLHHMQIIAPFSAAGRRRKGAQKRPRMLPPKKQAYNKRVRELRSRVETPFAAVKNRFESLSHAWLEEEGQQESLVFFAFGLLAFLKK